MSSYLLWFFLLDSASPQLPKEHHFMPESLLRDLTVVLTLLCLKKIIFFKWELFEETQGC